MLYSDEAMHQVRQEIPRKGSSRSGIGQVKARVCVSRSLPLTFHALMMLWSKMAKQMRNESTVAKITRRELKALRMSRLEENFPIRHN